jgi:hypothetical protein
MLLLFLKQNLTSRRPKVNLREALSLLINLKIGLTFNQNLSASLIDFQPSSQS